LVGDRKLAARVRAASSICKWLKPALCGAVLLSASPGHAQTEPDPASATEEAALEAKALCVFDHLEARESEPGQLRAYCEGQAYPLGAAESFVTSTNPALQATIVEVRLYGHVRLWLFRPGAKGGARLTNITSDLAVGAGRAPWSAIEDMTFDHEGFAADGVVRASAPAVDEEGAILPGKVSQAAAVRIADLAEREDARRAAALAAGELVEAQ
jgi:hypothetical protein